MTKHFEETLDTLIRKEYEHILKGHRTILDAFKRRAKEEYEKSLKEKDHYEQRST